MVLLGSPLAFAAMTILWHHVTGVPIGTFDHPQPDVPFQASFHLVLEVDGDITGGVDCDRSGILVNQ